MDIVNNMAPEDWWLIIFCAGGCALFVALGILMYGRERNERKAMTPAQLQKERDDRVI